MRYIIIGQTHRQAEYYLREHREKFLNRRGRLVSMDQLQYIQGVRTDVEVIVLDGCWWGPYEDVVRLEDEMARLKAIGVNVRSGGEWLG
jgi:hypothetical protein